MDIWDYGTDSINILPIYLLPFYTLAHLSIASTSLEALEPAQILVWVRPNVGELTFSESSLHATTYSDLCTNVPTSLFLKMNDSKEHVGHHFSGFFNGIKLQL